MKEPWFPQPGTGGLFLAFGILVALISRNVLSAEAAHGILDEQAAVLEDLANHPGTGAAAKAHLCAGLRDLAWLRDMLQANPLTRLPD